MPSPALDLMTVENPGEEIFAAIAARLDAFNASKAGPDRHLAVAILIKDRDGGAIAGGLWGESFYDWLFVKLLFIPETARGGGLGGRILGEAERIAATRNCVGIWLDTFEFQARGFYEKHGYTLFGTLGDHPRGMNRYFLQKRLG